VQPLEITQLIELINQAVSLEAEVNELLQKRPEEVVTEISNILTPTWPNQRLQLFPKDSRLEKTASPSYQHALILKSDVRHLIGLLEEILISDEVFQPKTQDFLRPSMHQQIVTQSQENKAIDF